MTGGIFEGFEDYRTATEDDYKDTLTSGMVVFDANVLLNLYRFNSTTRADLIKVMQSLGDSLWIPHQVMREFWRNRESVIDQLGETPKESLTKLDKARQDAEEAVRAWSNRIYLPEGERDGLLTRLNGAFQAVRHTISEQAAANAHPHDTNADEIVAALGSIVAGRTGAALSPEDHDAAVVEAERRIAAKEPPGYQDKDKPDAEGRAGDYLVWKQVLLEAERQPRDVLLVTSDGKDDWWRRTKGQLRGPRLELMAEFRRCTGHRLFMITASELIRRADSLTDVHVNPESAEDIERVETTNAEPIPVDVAKGVVAEIYRRLANEHDSLLPSRKEYRVFSEWIEDPLIGGVLLDYMPAEQAREWIKETELHHNLDALDGRGPYAHLVPRRYQTVDEIVVAACGPDWHQLPDSKGVVPNHCYATNGTDIRSVCWGRESPFDELLAIASRVQDPAHVRPVIMVLQHAPLSDPEYYASVASKAGFDLAHQQLELRPNPDYVGQ
ncbi:hypothetical protein BBK82_40025 [Lentzea guizhouensis]|uniref:PIN like domain-containing protein n=1 Tax=Lentzea guizhouensis TaxID=1586287 RepID=A0A1B2HU32_9PSEU|nr:hypothetical protein BBK82_40025 [Lentzea guizhouensis]